eukprot:TRINITY_DN23512_c0_g1_i1.p1 TRINITY_DN23512_c0_g1~~TRINITY_DN23512_c0_g1_i1.p1  ORF type:complete len:273 (-),score=64.49 TRINITY_DN23512_c0_g1_i1:23-841(-)
MSQPSTARSNRSNRSKKTPRPAIHPDDPPHIQEAVRRTQERLLREKEMQALMLEEDLASITEAHRSAKVDTKAENEVKVEKGLKKAEERARAWRLKQKQQKAAEEAERDAYLKGLRPATLPAPTPEAAQGVAKASERNAKIRAQILADRKKKKKEERERQKMIEAAAEKSNAHRQAAKQRLRERELRETEKRLQEVEFLIEMQKSSIQAMEVAQHLDPREYRKTNLPLRKQAELVLSQEKKEKRKLASQKVSATLLNKRENNRVAKIMGYSI